MNRANPQDERKKAEPTENELCDLEDAILNVYRSLWIRSLSPRDAGSSKRAASELRLSMVSSSFPEYSVQCSVTALRQFAFNTPLAIDYLLGIIWDAVTELPSFVCKQQERDPEAGREALRKCLRSKTSLYELGDSTVPSQKLKREEGEGGEDWYEGTSARSTLSRAFHDVQRWKERKHLIIVSAALQSRCLARGILTQEDQTHFKKDLDGLTDLTTMCKPDIVTACIFLRGCAKTWFGRCDKEQMGWLSKWQYQLHQGLLSKIARGIAYSPLEEWAVKVNAMVGFLPFCPFIRNLHRRLIGESLASTTKFD